MEEALSPVAKCYNSGGSWKVCVHGQQPVREFSSRQHAEDYIATQYSPTELAKRMKVSVSTLQKMRERGDGPRYFKLGKAVFYPAPWVDAYILERARHSTSSR